MLQLSGGIDLLHPCTIENEAGISYETICTTLTKCFEGIHPKKILLLPPDYTRMYSGAGMLVHAIWQMLHTTCEIEIMPALGTHVPMTEAEFHAFFGNEIPFSAMRIHRWREDVVKIGEVPASFVASVSEGLVSTSIDVEVNKRLLDPSYDLILSIGQVVPHEVVGMANYSKNIFVGCGGASMINASHMLGAFYGMERIMGRDHSPVRQVFDYAQTHFLTGLPLAYILTCATAPKEETVIHGLYIGSTRDIFEKAVAESQKKNLIHMDRPIDKAVVYLDPLEYRSTWLGNKAIYRTRMAIRDGGELLILAPGVERFGEDMENDRLIRKYGYVGRQEILRLIQEPDNADLRANLSVAAHLIHGSSDGRFSITYATERLPCRDVENVHFRWTEYTKAIVQYDPHTMHEGWNNLAGEEIYFIHNPALGLWTFDGKAAKDEIH